MKGIEAGPIAVPTEREVQDLHKERKLHESTIMQAHNEAWIAAAHARGREIKGLDAKLLVDPAIPLSKSFKRGKILGKGAFGQVRLWTHGGKAYAIKRLAKRHARALISAIREHKRLLELEHSALAKGYYLLRKKQGIYLVMQYILGGTFKDAEDPPKHRSYEKTVKVVGALRYLLKKELLPYDCNDGNLMINGTLIDMGAYISIDQVKKDRTRFKNLMGELSTLLGLVLPDSEAGRALLGEARNIKVIESVDLERVDRYIANWLDSVEMLCKTEE